MTAVLEPPAHKPTLDELAATANERYLEAEGAASAHLLYALACGDALNEAKTQVERGGWMTWLQAKFAGTPTTAHKYMRCACHRAFLIENDARDIRHGLELLRDAGRMGNKRGIDMRMDLKNEAVDLSREGVSGSRIADVLGVNRKTVTYWLNPEARANSLRRHSEWQKQRTLERQALERERRDQAVKKALVHAGQGLNEAYRLVTRLDGILGQARAEATDGEQRIAINEAHAHRDKMMDALIRAIGVS